MDASAYGISMEIVFKRLKMNKPALWLSSSSKEDRWLLPQMIILFLFMTSSFEQLYSQLPFLFIFISLPII